jgi:hypothetical protein
MIEFVPASPAHVGTLANRMRDIDRKECAIMGRTPKQALRLSLHASYAAWTAKVDGRPEAMFGVASVSLLGGEGSPWLLMTDEATRHARALLVEGRRYSDMMQRVFPVLANNVHADNAVAIRWLSRLGYTLGPVFDMAGHPMRAFERRA